MKVLKEISKNTLKNSLALGSNLRSALYLIESTPLLYLEQWIRFKKLQKPTALIDEKKLLTEVTRLFRKDSNNFKEYSLPLNLLEFENPSQHIKTLAKIYLDSIDVYYNKKFKKNKVFNVDTGPLKNKLPEYYLRNFHNQTDGYLSEHSALLYEQQVEMLFRGTAAAMRRLLIPHLLDVLDRKEAHKIIETGCGTGISTKILSTIFKDSHIRAYDLSEAYLNYARTKRYSDNTNYQFGNAENLAEVESDSIDLWSSTYMFHELPQTARIHAVKEAHRMLKKNGKICILDSIQKHDREDFNVILKAFPQNFHEPFYKNYTENPLEELLEKESFKVLKSKSTFLTKVVIAEKM